MPGFVPGLLSGDAAVSGVLRLARELQRVARGASPPPPTGKRPKSEHVIPRSVTLGSRGYIESLVDQINGCYEQGWFDAAAVLMRRLVETLLIEVFEANEVAHEVQTPKGDFKPLDDLINRAVGERKRWNLSRDSKRALPAVKVLGDKAAHSRRFNVHLGDVDHISAEFRALVQELVYLAKLK